MKRLLAARRRLRGAAMRWSNIDIGAERELMGGEHAVKYAVGAEDELWEAAREYAAAYAEYKGDTNG